jgi:hypothetical protein
VLEARVSARPAGAPPDEQQGGEREQEEILDPRQPGDAERQRRDNGRAW